MIIAIDFDGILCDDNFPEIGNPHYTMINLVKEWISEGHEVILWTCRTGEALEKAVAWCKELEIEFTAINDQAPSNKAKYLSKYPQGTRKVSADVYIDDHNLEFLMQGGPYYINSIRRFIEECRKKEVN